jgi:ubiquitin carboxyl-terminal hydrolase 14
MSTAVPLTIKWGKETVDFNFVPETGVKGLKTELEEKTGVPVDRMKLMAKSKGLWKGVMKDDLDLASLDWQGAVAKAGSAGIQLLLIGSAAKLTGPSTTTVFLEDLAPEEVAKVQEPSGLVNLGNTCYLNSVVQCLRVIPALRQGLSVYTPASDSNTGNRNAAHTMFLSSLRSTYQSLDRQANPVQPMALVQATKMAFPQFAERGRNGNPIQQDAEEFLNGLFTIAASLGDRQQLLQASLPNVSSESLLGASNWMDAIFGLKLEETLTCDEVELEPPVVTEDLHRKLVCNIQGGSDVAATQNVSHVYDGIALSLQGSMEKHSDVLGRNAIWTRKQRIARLPPILVMQFGRFFWKATPDSQDHAGVKCKVMKPVAFGSTLDVYDFCTESVKAVLKRSRDKALKEEEDRINQKLQGHSNMEGENGDAMQVDGTENDKHDDKAEEPSRTEVEADEDLQAALAMSLETTDGTAKTPIGPGLPENFQGQYELFAVITHKGRDADGGHYMAWVKADNPSGNQVEKIIDTDEANEDWFVFDDDEVSPCKTEDVLKLKGGGDWHMSYLNFYRAKK